MPTKRTISSRSPRRIPVARWFLPHWPLPKRKAVPARNSCGRWRSDKDEGQGEKGVDFGGMGARNGVTAVTMVQAGLTGVFDVLDGTHNLFIALSTNPKPEAMLEGLGSRFYVTETAIKTFSVGYPIQSPLDALLTLRKQYG